MGSVCILDYGSGNVKSVFNLFLTIAKHVVISNEPAEIQRATHIVLPGVGAFSATMRKIRERLPMEVLEQAVLSDKKTFSGDLCWDAGIGHPGHGVWGVSWTWMDRRKRGKGRLQAAPSSSHRLE